MKDDSQSKVKLAWLIQDERGLAPGMVRLMKKLIGARSLVVFPSLELALAKASRSREPEVIFSHGIGPLAKLQQLQASCPHARLILLMPYEEICEASQPFGSGPVNPSPPQAALPKYDYGLTTREKSILQLMVQGWLKKEIAERLSLSFHTVNNHERHIYEKLHVHTRSAAVAKALMEGLLS